MDEASLWAELGKAAKDEHIGMLPEEEEQGLSDAQIGYSFFKRQLPHIKKIYCHPKIVDALTNEQKRDVVMFVSGLIDLFGAYFGKVVGTILLVQLYKIGIDRFCDFDAE